MADVREGLAVGGEKGLDPNDSRAFEQIMEGKGVPKAAGEGDTPSTDVRSGLTTDEPGQGREPDGKFSPKDTSAAPAPDTSKGGAPAPAAAPAGEDPELASFLAKYGGDTQAALKAAANQQSLLGRQGEEVRQTREEMAELRGRLDAMATMQAQGPAAPVLTTDEVEERAADRIATLGYPDAATEAANLAITTGDERAYRTVFEQWNLEDPFAAQTHIADFRAWQREQAAVASAPAAVEEPWMTTAREQAIVNSLVQGITMIAPEYGGQEALAPLAPHFEAVYESLPKNVTSMIASSDPEARAAGLRIFVDRAILVAGRTAPVDPKPVEPQDPAVPASVARKLAGAAVASGSLRPPAESPATPQTREDAIKEFKRELMETETTNVRSGLTYAK